MRGNNQFLGILTILTAAVAATDTVLKRPLVVDL
jgi:hypothetical protein